MTGKARRIVLDAGGWLAGSIATGLLYEHSRLALVVCAASAQLASIPFFILAARGSDRESGR